MINKAPDKAFDVVAACGNWPASIANGGSSQSAKAHSAPNSRRHGRRSSATHNTATVKASASNQIRPSPSTPARSALIVQFLQQPAQLGNVLLGKLALVG